MISRKTEQATGKQAWRTHATHIADWEIENLVNRFDQATYWIQGGWLAVAGDVKQRLFVNCRELSPTVVYSQSADGLCKWVCLDFDNHDERQDVAEQNLQTAVAIVNTLIELGIVAMLEDSDGQGGLHLWILFAPAIDLESAYKFARWIRSDYPSLDIECNPKQRKGGQFGNGVRLPGAHHKRDHYSRFWGDAEWLSHAESIDLMLSTKPNSPAVLGLMRDFDPDPRPQPKPKRPLPRPQFRDGGGIIAQAESHIDQIPWPDLLQHFGWHGEGKFWTRPGKSHGTSATLDHGGNGLLHVFSSAAGLPVDSGPKAGQSFGKWRFWLYMSGFSDHQQRDGAQRYLQGVSR